MLRTRPRSLGGRLRGLAEVGCLSEGSDQSAGQGSLKRGAFVATRLGISQEEVARCLRALSDSKLIARRARRFVVTRMLTVDTTRNPDAGTSCDASSRARSPPSALHSSTSS